MVREEATRRGEGGRKPLCVARKAVLRKEVKKTDGSPKGPVNKNV